jgi:L-amino acid N-acyltransferase YncA
LIVRGATAADAGAVAAIYGQHVLTGLGTFEEAPPGEAEIAARMAGVLALGLPYLVLEDAGAILGFSYAAPFRQRAAYRYTAEESVYIHPDHLGRGLGKALVADVIAACAALGLRQLVAVIGDSGNAGSIGLHRSLGFVEIGVGRGFGFKHGRWVDIVQMQKPLNGGQTTPPTAPGLSLGGA